MKKSVFVFLACTLVLLFIFTLAVICIEACSEHALSDHTLTVFREMFDAERGTTPVSPITHPRSTAEDVYVRCSAGLLNYDLIPVYVRLFLYSSFRC